jgi:type IV pilus assembly protein PilN
MTENDQDKNNLENKEEEVKSEENQSQGESAPTGAQTTESLDSPNESNKNQNENQLEVEEKKENEVIHKKDGRLHIYVRQDKYKGELKSKNWVGRLYIDGKQKISSSGTPNLDDAIPILEKWFDDVHADADKEKEEQTSQEITKTTNEEPSTPPITETTNQTEVGTSGEKKPEVATANVSSAPVEANKESSETKPASNILEKFKNIKFKKPSFGKQDSETKSSSPGKDNIRKKFASFIKSKLGKSSVQGEEIVGVELTATEIRLAQLTSNKSNQWILDKFYIHPIEGLPDNSTVLENPDKIAEELQVALQKAKITITNAAIAIPVTSAIIRVVTAPLMTDEELTKAIETNSLWENLVQLTDNLGDYSIFHQVIDKNKTANTMDILFVASKLSDINSYTSIIKKGGLNAVIIDVKCFALKSAVDQMNKISGSIEDSNLTAVLEFGLDENYVMILYENNPIITDIFIRGQDRNTLLKSDNQEEMDALVRRYMTQVKQAIQDFESKYEKRIRSLRVVSNLKNVNTYLGNFRKSLVNTGFNLFDPVKEVQVPAQIKERVNIENRSYLATVIGLAFRKLDVFGYYKFVTAVKNINLLPNRQSMIAKKKAKVFSNFAFKGVVGAVAGIYIILFGLSFWQMHSLNKKLSGYDQVVQEHGLKTIEKAKYAKEVGIIVKSLKLSQSIKSNKKFSFRILAQIASAVPKRVKFNSINYNGSDQVIIIGLAANDEDILKLINNLNSKKLILQASLASMTMPEGGDAGKPKMKGFKIACVVENI